jgi:hydrophobic/amphiphilic exporter-1 (mainly G- bacteria), HAE1 family
MNNLVVGHFQGKSVFLRDVALVRDTLRDLTVDERIDGMQGVRLMVMKQSGANTVTVARDVKNAIAELQKDLPPDITVREIIDTSQFISGSVINLSQTMLWALFFVMLVVLFFLGKWRATFIIDTYHTHIADSFIYLPFCNRRIA